ncbi:MAG: leukotoxin LktA family filamentous adhesin [Gammaproteobacteria bacterium]|nr:leukotoxin LktA family filamentous adhesin [Gammaproteobacteria bacterium]
MHSQLRQFQVPRVQLKTMVRCIAVALAVREAGFTQDVMAQVVPDGQTATSVSASGAVANVTTTTQRGANAFNSFSRFDVPVGQTVNLHLPDTSTNLINIVRDSRTDIDGVLNSVSHGAIGGNVYIVNPHGVMVGPSGTVNVGALTVTTPTQAFVDGVFSSPGVPDDASVARILDGSAPLDNDAAVVIDGRVNAIDGASLHAGTIAIGGAVYAGADFVGNQPDFTDVVNVDGVTAGGRAVLRNGRIEIAASHAAVVTGTLASEGTNGVAGGTVAIRAGQRVEVGEGATVSVRGRGLDSDGGTVDVYGQQAATLAQGATIDASAGDPGDGGFIEFSARDTVTLAGGQFKAGARDGTAGRVLIDPDTFVLNGVAPNGDVFTDGADFTVQADSSITISNTVISTRKVAPADANRGAIATAGSTGNSGNIVLEAPSITVDNNSALYSQANNGFTGGTVRLLADQPDGGTAAIAVTNATVMARDIEMRATTAQSHSLLPVAVAINNASVNINNSRIEAVGGAINLTASSEVDIVTPEISPLSTVVVTSIADVKVTGTSQVKATGDANLTATSTVTADALAGEPDPGVLPGDAGVASNTVISHANAIIGGTTTVDVGGTLALTALNTTSAQAIANAVTGDGSGSGGTAAELVLDSQTHASIEGTATVLHTGAIALTADTSNDLNTTAIAAVGGAEEDESGTSFTEQLLANHQDQASTTDGTIGFAAAVAVSVLNSATHAGITTTAPVQSDGAVLVSSTAVNSAMVTADGTAATGGGVGAAVAINIGVLSNQAYIGDDANLDIGGLSLSAMAPINAVNAFDTSATSGAGSATVGVAGALAVNVVANQTNARIEGDRDNDGGGGIVGLRGGDVIIDSRNGTLSVVRSKAAVTPPSEDDSGALGVGATVATNVVVNGTVAEIEDKATVNAVNDIALLAEGSYDTQTEVEGGAAGATIAVTPVAAATVAVNYTSARLGNGAAQIAGGDFSANAIHNASTTTTSAGATSGDTVAVGTTLAVNVATDTVLATIARDLNAGGAIDVAADSTATSSVSATASVAGGAEADENDNPTSGDANTPGKTVDQQVTAQRSDATRKGSAADQSVADGLNNGTSEDPKAETSEGGVSVAAAVGVNVGVATTIASIAPDVDIVGGGQFTLLSSAATDASATADGTQSNSGGTRVGVGAAVALNVGVSTNLAIISDDASVRAAGIALNAITPAGQANDFGAEATSGAGAQTVGVAGSLAVNVIVNQSIATLEGDKDNDGTAASVDVEGGDLELTATNTSNSEVKATSDVSADGAAAGVGASIGLNVVVNNAIADVEDKAVVVDVNDVSLSATGEHTATTEVEGGAAGAKVSVTPVLGVTLAFDQTRARIGSSATALTATGDVSLTVTHSNETETKAEGKAQGDVAVGASLSATLALDTANAEVARDINADSLTLAADSTLKLTTNSTAGAKGADEQEEGNEAPGSKVEEQKAEQIDFAKSRNTAASGADTTTPQAKTPDTDTDQTGNNKQQGKEVSVAAAIGVGVAQNQALAQITTNRTISLTGDLSLTAKTDTNYTTGASGEAVADDVGVAAAIALTGTRNVTRASIGAGTDITQAGDIELRAEASQNRDSAFLTRMSAEAISGAGGGDVAVAGALAIVANDNQTWATIDEGVTLGSAINPVGDIVIDAQDTSKITAQARAGSLAQGGDQGNAKAGIGASFAVLLSNNQTLALLGRQIDGTYGATLAFANSVSLNAAKNKVIFNNPLDLITITTNPNDPLDPTGYIEAVEAFDFELLDPASYLGSNNYYAEAVAGAVAKGAAAVAGSFAVELFHNRTQSEIGGSVDLTTFGNRVAQPGEESLGVLLNAQADTQAIGFGGAVAGAKKAGVGLTLVTIGNYDETFATIADQAKVRATGLNSGVDVSANASQDVANVGVSAAAAQESAAVGGVLGINLSVNRVKADIGAGALVQATGNVSLDADNGSVLVMIAGGVGAAKEVGVGAAIGANLLFNETGARIGDGAQVDAMAATRLTADANEVLVNAVVAGAGAGKAGVAGSLGINSIFALTESAIGQNVLLNSDPVYSGANQFVLIHAQDDTVGVGVSGAGAGGGKAGVGAALGTNLFAKLVRAFVADDDTNDGRHTTIDAHDMAVEAIASDIEVGITAGFAGGSNAGVGGAVSLDIVRNDIDAYIGEGAEVDAEGNVLINAQDDITAFLVAGSGAGGGDVGVGGSLGIATLLGTTSAYVADNAIVSARGNGNAANVYSGDTVISPLPDDSDTPPGALLARPQMALKGLSVTAYNRENLISAVVGGAGGGKVGVAATVGGNVIATNTEAWIGSAARINQNNAGASAEQQVHVAAVDEALLLDVAGAGAGGGQVGVGAAGSFDIIARTTHAWIGEGALINARDAFSLDAASGVISFTTTAGFAGGGQVGVGGAVAGIAVADTTEAYIEDAATNNAGATVNVTAGDLDLKATSIATSWLLSGAGAGGGQAGVGISMAVGVNTSITRAQIGDHANTNASGATNVRANSIENVNSAVIGGAGGGAAGVGGSVGLNIVASTTEASIGDFARVNQDFAGDDVTVEAIDKVITVGIGGAGAGGGAAGVGGTAVVTAAFNTTSSYIGTGAVVSADNDVTVSSSSDKYVNSVTIAGAGGGTAGVAGAVSIISVGSLLDGEAKSGLGDGATIDYADGQTTKSPVSDQLGTTDEALEVTHTLDNLVGKLAIGPFLQSSTAVPLRNTQAFIADGADVRAGHDINVTAHDATLALLATGGGAGGGAAGVMGAAGVVLIHDSAEAFIGDGAQVDADHLVNVSANTRDSVANIGITGAGAGAAEVSGALSINVISSDTAAHINAADVNQRASASTTQAVNVSAESDSRMGAVAGSGGGAGAAAVGGVLDANTLTKRTKAYIADGADVAADTDINVKANSEQIIIGAAARIGGAGAAAVGGAAAANVIANFTEAFIGKAKDDTTPATGAMVDSDGNVSLEAVDDTLLISVTGIGNGAGAAGVGGDVSANGLYSATRAYISANSTVNARGNAAGRDVLDGTIDPLLASLIPDLPGGAGDIDLDRDGNAEGSINRGLSLNIEAEGDENGEGGGESAVDPAAPALGNDPIAGAQGGLGFKSVESNVKGLSVVAMGNEKLISADIGVAGAGAAAVTGAAHVDLILTETEAFIGDGVTINSVPGGADPSVRVTAADNTFEVMGVGTFSGAGAVAVSGALSTAVVVKTTSAHIGDVVINANDLELQALSTEELYNVTGNLSVAGAAGVGAALGVDVVRNDTRAWIGAGADIQATGDLLVHANQNTAVNFFTLSGAGGATAAVSGALAVGVIANTTQAYIEDADNAGDGVDIDAAGTLTVKAESEEAFISGTVSGAVSGMAGIAGALAVKVVASDTQAYIGDYAAVNQRLNGATQDVNVLADDTVTIHGESGAAAQGSIAAVGATAEISIVRNTTAAFLGEHTELAADRDLLIDATSTKNTQAAALAASGSISVGISGAVALASVGASLDQQSQDSLRDPSSGGNVADYADSRMRDDQVSGQLGDSEHVASTRTQLGQQLGGLDVGGQLNESSGSSLDKTRAYVGAGSVIDTGRHASVIATDTVKVDLTAVGASVGLAGIGGAVGVGLVNSTVEAFVNDGTIVNAGGNVLIHAASTDLDADGSNVRATAGAGGVVGASAAVAVLTDSSVVQSYLDNGSEVRSAIDLAVTASTHHLSRTYSLGASAGALAIGASVSYSGFTGTTSAYLGDAVLIGQANGSTVNTVTVAADDGSRAQALAVAGTAGILSGSGAVADATATNEVSAFTGSDTRIHTQGATEIAATATPGAQTDALGVNVGAGAVGASISTASVEVDTAAILGVRNVIQAAQLDINATRNIGGDSTTLARAMGAAGGLLLGANATLAQAQTAGDTQASVGNNSTLNVSGTTTVNANSHSLQAASGTGVATGYVALGADVTLAGSSGTTTAMLGNSVTVTGNELQVLANSSDTNYALGIAGAGGVVSAPFSYSSTSDSSDTWASTGSGDASHVIDVTTAVIESRHTADFDSWMINGNASLIGVSGAQVTNEVVSTVTTAVASNGRIEADNIAIGADNIVLKHGPAIIPGLNVFNPGWNVYSISGGLADVPAADSVTSLATITLVDVGNNARLTQTGNAAAPGNFNLRAQNDIDATDRVTMTSGGAVSAASARSAIEAGDAVSTVSIGDGATLRSLGVIEIEAGTTADISTQAAVDVYGLVGVAPFGETVSRIETDNAVVIGTGAQLESERDILVAAWSGSDNSLDSLHLNARTDVYNNTVIPVSRNPVADAIANTTSTVTISSGADLSAVRNVELTAGEGAVQGVGVGVGKDVYREVAAEIASAFSEAFGGDPVSFETRTGTTAFKQDSTVAVAGEVHVGTNRQQTLTIGMDYTQAEHTDGINIEAITVRSVVEDILQRINDLRELIREYKVDDTNSDAGIAVAAYEAEVRFLEHKLDEMGYGEPGFYNNATVSPLQAAQDAVTALTSTRSNQQSDKAGLEAANLQLNIDLAAEQTNNGNIQTDIGNLDSNDPNYATDLADLQADLAVSDGLIQQYNTDITQNDTDIGDLTTSIADLTLLIDDLNTDIGNNVYSSAVPAGPLVTELTVSPASAQLGNIYIRGDRLQGNGQLDAPGDAEIRVTNNSPYFLRLQDLEIPTDAGGAIYFNSVEVEDNARINAINGSGAAAFTLTTAEGQSAGEPAIIVQSNFNPLDNFWLTQVPADVPALAPEIIVDGALSNVRGLVRVVSEAGTIRLTGNASIRANRVEVAANNGDFIQSYSDGFYNTGGSVLSMTQVNGLDTITYTAETAGSGIVANGSVLLAARYLNINGIVQSGVPEWGVLIPANATVTIGNGSGSFAQAVQDYNAKSPAQQAVAGAEFYDVVGPTTAGLSGNTQGEWVNVGVRFNARENRLELTGVQVQGGYIELFGQIFNTNDPGNAASGAGRLRVMDGYGQVKVDNQTSMPLWLNTLDTGRGVNGEINITNISGLDAQGNPVVTTTHYERAPGAARTGYSFSPQTNLRYSMTVGADSRTDQFYRYWSTSFFGIAQLSTIPNLADYRLSSSTTNDPLSRGEFLGVLTNSPTTHTNTRTETVGANSVLTPGRSWMECNWWSLCVTQTYYQEFAITSSSKQIKTTSVKADYPIAIEYIGFDQGAVDIHSAGDIIVGGSINNRNGDTALVSTAGSILQAGDLPIVNGNNTSLEAALGIGNSGQALQVNTADGGRLDAAVAAGGLYVDEVLGDLRIGLIGGANADVVSVAADGSLLNDDPNSLVQGLRVDLLSRNGGIGELTATTNDPVIVRTGYSANQALWPTLGLTATARDNITIANVADNANAADFTGNLLVNAVQSLSGDVYLETAGSVIDNNPYATTDTRTQQELAALWDELRLRGAPSQDKADEAVAAFEANREASYQLYWQLRRRQSDSGAVYDPAFQYRVTTTERDALLASGMDSAAISQFENARTEQYHLLNEDVGALTAGYEATFTYSASVDEQAAIRQGSSWSDAQLLLPIGAGLLKGVTDTVTTIKNPNVVGNNVTLVATGAIGSTDAPLDIDFSVGVNAITDAQKAALAAAERGDATVNGTVVTITQPRPVNVTVGQGALNASALAGVAYVGSEHDLRLDQVTATDEVRIKTAGSLVNAGATPNTTNVSGSRIILEAATGGIGSLPDANGVVQSALLIMPGAGEGLIARASDDIWLSLPGDVSVDTIFSLHDIRLDVEGSIIDFQAAESALAPDLNLRGANIHLTSLTGSIGAITNALDVGVNADGLLNAVTLGQGATVAGIYLHAPLGEHLNLGTLTSADALNVSAQGDARVAGVLSAPASITLSTAGLLSLGQDAVLHSTVGDIILVSNGLIMEDAGDFLQAALIDAELGEVDAQSEGDIRVTRIRAGGRARLNAAGSLLGAGQLAAPHLKAGTLALTATQGSIGAEDEEALRIEIASGGALMATAATDARFIANGDVAVTSITATDNVLLDASGAIVDTDTADPASSIDIAATNVILRAGGSLGAADNTLDLAITDGGTIAASGAGVYLYMPAAAAFTTSDVISTAALTMTTGGDLTIAGAFTATDAIDLLADGLLEMTVDAFTHTVDGDIVVRAAGLTMSDANDGQHAAQLVADTGTIDVEVTGDARITGMASGNGTVDAVRIVSTAGGIFDNGDTRLDIIADTLPEATLTLSAALGIGSNPLEVRLLNLVAEAGEEIGLAADSPVNIVSLTAGGDVGLQATGDITGTGVTSANGSIALTSTGGDIALEDIFGAGDVSVTGAADVAVVTIVAGGNADVMAGSDINGESVTAGGDVALGSRAGDITLDGVSGGGNVNVDGAADVSINMVDAGGAAAFMAGGGFSSQAVTAVGDINMVTATGDVSVNEVRSGGDVVVDAGGMLDVAALSASGDVQLAAGADIVGGVVSSGGAAAMASATGQILFDDISAANAVTLSAPLAIDVALITLGGDLTLASDLIDFTAVASGNAVMGGRITGFDGGPATQVTAAFDVPGGVALTQFSTADGTVQMLSGELSIANLLVLNRLTISNDLTHVLIEQNSRALESFDIQLYSGATPFSLALSANRLFTSSLVIARNPRFQITTPFGYNAGVSALEEAFAALAEALRGQVREEQQRDDVEGDVSVVGDGVWLGLIDECSEEDGAACR